MLTGVATLAGAAAPAFAAGPQIDAFPSVVAPGQPVSVSIVCIDGKDVGTSATFFGTTLGLPARIPMSPATHKGVFVTTVRVPAGTASGTYAPSVDCGNGLSGLATLTVRAAAPKPVVVPSGVPVTGDGVTSTAVGGPLAAAGLGVLGLSALIGAVASWRRKPGK